jgi:hypothetical protein
VRGRKPAVARRAAHGHAELWSQQIVPVLAGAELELSDGTTTQPVRLKSVVGTLQGRQGAPVTTVYTIKVEIPGIAQFPSQAGE